MQPLLQLSTRLHLCRYQYQYQHQHQHQHQQPLLQPFLVLHLTITCPNSQALLVLVWRPQSPFAPNCHKMIFDLLLPLYASLPEKSSYEIMKTPEVLLMDSTHASKKNQMYISVWKSVQSFNPGIRFQKHWKGHVLVQDSMAKHLFYLGEYEGGGSCKLSSGEYRSLPKETKQVLFGLAKGLRQDDIYDLNDLFLSMRKDDGIFIVKTELRHVGYSSAIEKSLKQEAKKRGFV
ncbi:hypothetical protein C8R42DRAFT_370258 [Lentinula raphanica]|nr:hypothetical protein C8R42DRAFT_370258 [Lentinula raphanica]